MATTVSFMGTRLKLSSRQEVFAAIELATSHPVRIATPNPEFMLLARENPRFKAALEGMTHHIVDGFGLSVFLKLLTWRSHTAAPTTKYSGVDFMEDLFACYSGGEKSFALLGGDPGAAEAKAQQLRAMYPSIKITSSRHGGKVSEANPVDSELLRELEAEKPDVLFVGFGAPKQELWIAAAKESSIPVMAGVGGSFNFATTKKRSPRILQNLKLEWLWRSLTERGHAKRAWRATVTFSLLALRDLVGRKTLPQE